MFSIENSYMGLFDYAEFVTLLINIVNIIFHEGNIRGDHWEIVILRRCLNQIQSNLSIFLLTISSIAFYAEFFFQLNEIRLQNLFIPLENCVLLKTTIPYKIWNILGNFVCNKGTITR